jgi:NAD-dependent dihydropyrimidine dehydrogenase PreA subunit
MDSSACVGCGLCVKRCHFNVFSRTEDGISCDTTDCVGCGICVNTCPTGALNLINRASN